jgi:hypothetical protein
VGQGEGLCDANARPAALLGTPGVEGKKYESGEGVVNCRNFRNSVR